MIYVKAVQMMFSHQEHLDRTNSSQCTTTFYYIYFASELKRIRLKTTLEETVYIKFLRALLQKKKRRLFLVQH